MDDDEESDLDLEILSAAARQYRGRKATPKPSQVTIRICFPTFDSKTMSYYFNDGSIAGVYTGWPENLHTEQRVTCRIAGHQRCVCLRSARRLPHERAWAEWLARGMRCKTAAQHKAEWANLSSTPVNFV